MRATVPSSRVLILGTQYDSDCQDIRAFLSANRIPYEWVDREREPERVPAGVPPDSGCPAVAIDGQLFMHPPTCGRSQTRCRYRPDRPATAMTWSLPEQARRAWPPVSTGLRKDSMF